MKENFNLTGSYIHLEGLEDGYGNLEGEVYLFDSGYFEGEINDDGSKIPNQMIKGYFQSGNGEDKINFLKFPKKSNLKNLAYSLSKESEKSFEGKYFGEWGALPYKTETKNESGIYEVKFDLSLADVGDYAEIEISKS